MPTVQFMQVEDAERVEKDPRGQSEHAVDCERENDPASHAPEHTEELKPVVAPKYPEGHGLAVEFVDPAKQNDPAKQGPEHDEDTKPMVLPYRPAGHNTHSVPL